MASFGGRTSFCGAFPPFFLGGGDQGTLGGYPRANALGGPSGVGNED